MTMVNYQLQKATTQLTESITRLENEITLLRSIELVAKKDGTGFKHLIKNFNSNLPHVGVSLDKESSGLSKNITINGYINNKYCRTDVSTYQLVKNTKKEIEESRIIKMAGVCAHYILTPEEIMENVASLIENKTKSLEEYRKELNNLQKDYEEVNKKFEEIRELLKDKSTLRSLFNNMYL